MKYIDFKEKLKNFTVFNLSDIRKFDSSFHSRRLCEWQAKKYIKMIRRGYYIFSDLDIDEAILFIIANKIYSPSYISFEIALSYYNLIPERVYGITSASTLKTSTFKTSFGEFIYRHVKPELLFGYELVKHKNYCYKIAEMEKALIDFFYLNSHIKTENDFAEIRFNSAEFAENSNSQKIFQYLKRFDNKSLKKRLNNFLEYISYAQFESNKTVLS